MREMSGEDKEQGDCSHSIHNMQGYQEQLLLLQQQHHQQMQEQNCTTDAYIGGGELGRSGLIYPQVSPTLTWPLPPVHTSNPVHFPPNPVRHHNPFLLPHPPSMYGGLFNRRPPDPQFAYEAGPSSDHLRLMSDTLGGQAVQPAGSSIFCLQAELGKMTAQEIMDAKALAASKSHSEAERRRRERINNHLAKLRSLLPSTTKTDKASLLAEVIQHVKELKRHTSEIAESSPVPTEDDELTVDEYDEDGKFMIKASLCCEDRPDLLPDLIKTLKALRLRTLKAEITTLGGRVKNVLFITGEEDSNDSDGQLQQYCSVSSIQEALRAVMEKTNGGDESTSGSVKRQRTNMMNIIEHSVVHWKGLKSTSNEFHLLISVFSSVPQNTDLGKEFQWLKTHWTVEIPIKGKIVPNNRREGLLEKIDGNEIL